MKKWSDEKYDLTIDHMNSIKTKNRRSFIQNKTQQSAPKMDISPNIFINVDNKFLLHWCLKFESVCQICVVSALQSTPLQVVLRKNPTHHNHIRLKTHIKLNLEPELLARDSYLLVFFVSLNPLTFYLNVLLFQYFVQYLKNWLERKN